MTSAMTPTFAQRKAALQEVRLRHPVDPLAGTYAARQPLTPQYGRRGKLQKPSEVWNYYKKGTTVLVAQQIDDYPLTFVEPSDPTPINAVDGVTIVRRRAGAGPVAPLEVSDTMVIPGLKKHGVPPRVPPAPDSTPTDDLRAQVAALANRVAEAEGRINTSDR